MTSLALIGGQFGSEGKGVIAAGLAHLFEVAVRTGGPNAGHSFYHERNLYKMQSVPCAWVSPRTSLAIGAGAVIDPDLLQREIALTGRVVFVDPQATIITPDMHAEERDAGMRTSIGSTTEGVGAARIAKIRRNGSMLAGAYEWTDERVVIEPIAPHLWDTRRRGGMIMLEGTQGASLSLHHGIYPFVTSNDTNAAQLAADAGLPPTDVEHTHLVIRTYPIRVAGNSGPTGGAEIEWGSLPYPPDIPERTTVTKNVRRIFTYNDADVQRAMVLNDPCGVWVNFGDYIDPDAKRRTDIDDLMSGPVGDWCREHIFPSGVRLMGVGVGGTFWRVIETGDSCWRPSPGHHSRTWPLRTTNG